MGEIRLSNGDVIKYGIIKPDRMCLHPGTEVGVKFPNGKMFACNLLDFTIIPGSVINVEKDLTDRDLAMMAIGSYLATRENEEKNNET